MGNRSKKAFNNILALSISEIVILIASLILPRVMLSYYGSSYNGLAISISQFLSYISWLTLGVAGPTRVVLYKTLCEGNIKGTSAIVKATEKFFHKIAVYFCIYAVVLSALLSILKQNEFEWWEVSSLVLIIAIGVFFEYCFGITYKTLLTADQKMYVYIWIQTIVKIINVGISVVLIVNGSSIFIAKLYASCCNAMIPFVILMYVRRKYGLDKRVAPDFSGMNQRKDAAASSIANIVHSNTDVFLLTIFTSSPIISVYSVYMLVMGGVQSIMRIFTTGLEAAFGNMWAKGETLAFSKNFNTYEFIMFSFVIIAFSCTGLLVLPFISLYTNVVDDINYIRPAFAILLTVTTAMFCIRQPYLTMVQATGKYKETRNGAILEAVLNFAVSLILVSKYDLVGITIGTLVANVVRTIQYAHFTSKYLVHRSMMVVAKRIIWAVTTTIIVVIISLPLFSIIKVDCWINWVLLSGSILVIATISVVIMALLFYRDDFVSTISIVKRVFFKKIKK